MHDQAYALDLRFNTGTCAERRRAMLAEIGVKLAGHSLINLPKEIICDCNVLSREKGLLTRGCYLRQGGSNNRQTADDRAASVN